MRDLFRGMAVGAWLSLGVWAGACGSPEATTLADVGVDVTGLEVDVPTGQGDADVAIAPEVEVVGPGLDASVDGDEGSVDVAQDADVGGAETTDALTDDGGDEGEVAGPPVDPCLGVVCDDGDPCDGLETCVDGACLDGEALLCDDGDPCNGLEACDGDTGGCVPGEPLCDDGDACNGLETCDPVTGACGAGEPVVCTDGDECNGTEVCDAATGLCEGGAPPVCADEDPCTLDECDPDVGCTVTPMCDDGDPCTNDICDPDAGFCDVAAKECDDGLLCTVDLCNPENGACEHTLQPFDNAACDDGDPCTTDVCAVLCVTGGACEHGCDHVPVSCTDGNGCTADTCEVSTGACIHTDISCDDGDPCTSDWCAPNGGCFWSDADCDDGNPCTVDVCEPGLGCSHFHTPVGVVACDDGDPCTVDTCEAGGECSHGPVDCDDQIPCTVDTCDVTTGGCEHDASDGGCDDGDPCTVDACAPDGSCTSSPKTCDDNQPCTVDSCLPGSGVCVHNWKDCDDGNVCNGIEACSPWNGECLPGTPTTCSDNNDCNGVEACDPATGGCVPGPALDCEATEYDGCAGPQTCQAPGTCVSQGNPACPAEPDECGGSGGVDWPETGTFSDSVAEAFVLKDEDQWDEKAALVDAIVAHSSATLTSMESILFNNLNRTGEQITVPGVDCFKYGFYWNDGDNKVDYWWPQGVSNSGVGYGDTTKGEDGKVLGRDVLLVAWYHKAEEDSSTSTYKGVRISIVDVSYINEFKYRHVILAEPVPGDDPAHPDLVPIASATSSVHAGGIAWYGDYLYVADTSKGLRVFDLTKMFQVQTGKKGSLGYVSSSDEYHGYNYRYVLPQVGRYKKCSQTCCARFSWVSVDPTTDPPSLLAGEYTDANVKARAHRWDLDPETSRLALSQGVSRASAVYFPGVKRMQGAVTIDGALFVSSSQPKTTLPVSAGTLYHADGLGEEMEDHQYPTLPEDLSYNPFWDDIWTCTEKPQNWMGPTRYCFRVSRSEVLGNQCD